MNYRAVTKIQNKYLISSADMAFRQFFLRSWSPDNVATSQCFCFTAPGRTPE